MAKTTQTTAPQHGRILSDYRRQAIVTKYHGPTNSRGSRISATAEAGRVYMGYRHELDIAENHAAAARMFALKFGWLASSDYVMGGTGDGYVFVAVPRWDA